MFRDPMRAATMADRGCQGLAHRRAGEIAATVLCCLMLLGGCAGEAVRVDPPDIPAPLVAPLPLRIGLRVAPGVRTYVYRDPYDVRFDVGLATTSAVLAASRAGFASVVELPVEAGAPPGDVDAVLEFAAIRWALADPARFEFRLLDASGQLIGDWTTSQSADFLDVIAEPGEPRSRIPSLYVAVVRLRIANAAAALMRDLREEPAIRAWLEARGAYRSAMPPAAPAGTVARIEAPSASPGISVLSDAESDWMRRCVIAGLRHAAPGRPISSAAALQEALFPWFSDRPDVALAASRLDALWQVPLARTRLGALGVGAFILVVGGTNQEQRGAGLCGAGQGGGGCLGLYWGARKSVVAARIVDFSRPGELLESGASRSGTTVVPMVGIPLPFIPVTAQAACDEVSRALAARLKAGPVR